MTDKKIEKVLISVFSKKGIDEICRSLKAQNIQIISTGGTAAYIESLGIPVIKVEDLSGYPSILDGRVKTLHPAVFGGILAKSNPEHQETLKDNNLPRIDAVIVDLYPFSKTVSSGGSHDDIIEKIDIGGISLIRAAAKNFSEVVVVPSSKQYAEFHKIVTIQKGNSSMEQRKNLAREAFQISSEYDIQISEYFGSSRSLRYGENPHQKALFQGDLEDCIQQLNGKDLSYNNLLDIDSALGIMAEVKDHPPTFAVIKHNNMCGFSEATSSLISWKNALAGDPVSAFGGIIAHNKIIDLETALEINKIFYEVLIAPEFTADALKLLTKKGKRIILELKKYPFQSQISRSIINGKLVQDSDTKVHQSADWKLATKIEASAEKLDDLVFANRLVKHLKSNAIALVKGKTLVGMGAGQTSRVDALNHAIKKATENGFNLDGAVMASDAFFPFNDCVEIAHKVGIKYVVQPGGSIKDEDSVNFCDDHQMAMYLTGFRHFKH